MAREPVIDADGHILERQSDVQRYLEPPWDRYSTTLWPTNQWNPDLFGSLVFPGYGEVSTPEEQVAIWLQTIEREGIETAVVFPTTQHVTDIREDAFAAALARALNNHLAADYGAASSRLRPVGVLPQRDPAAAAQELRRAATELGLVAFVLLPQGLPLGLGDPFFDPIYAEAERLNVPLCVHATRFDEREVGGHIFKTFNEVHTWVMAASVMLHFTSILFNAVPLRFPKLKLAFLEAGATWLPYYLDRMDDHWELRGEYDSPQLTVPPSELFRSSQLYISGEPDEALIAQTINYIGDDHFLFASDFPHQDSKFPKNLEEFEERRDLSEETKRKVLYENARRLFNL